jgi:hypothetical protein
MPLNGFGCRIWGWAGGDFESDGRFAGDGGGGAGAAVSGRGAQICQRSRASRSRKPGCLRPLRVARIYQKLITTYSGFDAGFAANDGNFPPPLGGNLARFAAGNRIRPGFPAW